MYSVPGTDIVFACIMCALSIALAYVIGRLTINTQLKNEVADLLNDRTDLCREYNELMDAFHSERTRWDETTKQNEGVWASLIDSQKKVLAKKHRLAMTKYKAKCDAKLVAHMSLLQDAMKVCEDDCK